MSVSSASASRSEPHRFNCRTLFSYGLPGLVTAIPTVPVYTLLPVFYAGHVGVGLALTGMVLFLSRALDVVTDPLIGYLTDRAGPAGLKTLLLTGALIGGPSLVLLLSPPDGAGAGWLFTCSVLLYLGWTLVQIPYLAWGARLSPLYHERTRLTAGLLLPALATLGIEDATPPATAVTALAMIYALVPCVFKFTAIAMVSGLPITQARQVAIATRLLRRDTG